MENPLSSILEKQNYVYHRRLTFASQCAWFIAMRLGLSPQAVAHAAQISRPTTLYLRRAGSFVGGQIRYPAVAREYTALGHDAFVHKYLTAGVRDQIAVAVDVVNRQVKDELNDKGFNPRANRYCRRHEWLDTWSGKPMVFRIELHPTRHGYFWRDLKPYGEAEIPADQVAYHPFCQLNGDPERGPELGPEAKGFARSDLCFRHVKLRYNPSAKQRAEMGL